MAERLAYVFSCPSSRGTVCRHRATPDDQDRSYTFYAAKIIAPSREYAENIPWNGIQDWSGVGRLTPRRRTAARETRRLLLLTASVIVVFAANVAGLFSGISTVLPHLFYLPIVLGAYWYPRRGVPFSLGLALGYLVISVPFISGEAGLLVQAIARAVVFVAIGAVISLLSIQLREREERYRGIFDNSEAGTFIIATEADGEHIEEVNYVGASLFGSTTDKLKGEPINRFFDDPAIWESLKSDIDLRGAVYGFETTLRRTDGGTVHALLSAGRLHGGGIVLTLVDITALKNAKETLRRTNAKLNMLGRLTHRDLAAAVSQLLGQITQGMRQFDDPAFHHYLEDLEESARLVQRRVEIARDYQDLGLRPADWQPLQEVIRRATSCLLIPPGVSIRSWVERLEVFADPMLDRVFSNLIENAIQHGKTVSSVVITYQILDDGLAIYVEDDGVGVPEENKERIFEYGFGSGGGLGLFLTKEILAITNMTIRETGTPGEGARFVIHVPPDGYRIT
jgi:PAS domain S-box-containing protein